MPHGAKLTPADVRRIFNYDPQTGVLTWREPKQGRQRGKPIGNIGHGGYAYGRTGGRGFLVHRIVWMWMTGQRPPAQIDHINGAYADNRWANLRAADSSTNQANARLSTRNTSGQKGVDWHNGKWRARVKVQKREIVLGHFEHFADAAAAYRAAAIAHFGPYARP